jgi:hypothetical protein
LPAAPKLYLETPYYVNQKRSIYTLKEVDVLVY